MLNTEEWDKVFNAIPDAITVHDAEGRITWANALAGKLKGGTWEGLIGQDCYQVFHSDGIGCPHAEVLERGKGMWAGNNVSVGDSTYSIYIAPIVDEMRGVTGYLRVMRNVAEGGKLHNQTHWAERFTTLGQMINGIAHDVGTPLNIISGYAEYLLMRTKQGEPGHKELSTILSQTRRIAEFIRQMLDLARPSQGRIDAIGLKGFLTESLDLMGHHLRKAQVRASLSCKTEPPLIYGDAPRLRQAFFNLLLNACQSAGSDGSLEIIQDEDTDESGFTRIRIIGYDKTGKALDLSKTFSTFLSTSEDSGAAGMGLSLAKEILGDFGTRFEASALPDDGTALVLHIPWRKQAAAQAIKREIS
jgi:signal transduction histidine kinase